MSLRPYAGEAKRERDLTLGPVAPWHTVVTVDVVFLERGRHSYFPHEKVFEVAAEWTGPPMIGFPPSSRPVQARDVHPVHDLDRARAIARRALEEFGRGGDTPPDLRAIAAELARRS